MPVLMERSATRCSRAAATPGLIARLRRRRRAPARVTTQPSRIRGVVCALLGLSFATVAIAASPTTALPRVTETLVAPPGVPAYDDVAAGAPQIVQVRLTIAEKQIDIDDGVRIWALTYNGSVPAPLIVVHQDDYLEVTLVNPPTNTMVHNIDFHAATGAMGGADLMNVAPGQQAVLRFKATTPGVFVYHCAPGGAMTPLHVAAGMSGALMVLPRDGLKDEKGQRLTYDRAYYIGEQDQHQQQGSCRNSVAGSSHVRAVLWKTRAWAWKASFATPL